MAADLRDKYIDDVLKFFKEYRITGQDTVLIANIISDPDQYDILRILRKEYVTRAELPVKIGREIANLDKLLKKLSEDHVITAIKDKKEHVWVLMLSDIIFPQFFPEYMVDVIRRRWKEGTIQKEIALKHLELLRAQYISTQAPKFRKKILETIVQIFNNADHAVKKQSWDQAATMLDQIANYFRDMGKRKTGEIVDACAKGIREDKEKYVEANWEQERTKILESAKEIEESDKAKIAAKKEEKKAKKKTAAPKRRRLQIKHPRRKLKKVKKGKSRTVSEEE